MNNIFLTGFMSSGKTVISAELAKITGRALIDTDELVEKTEGMTITEIFFRYGEEYFRNAETKILGIAAKEDGAIISTGGGIVLREENRKIMRENGIIAALMPEFSVIQARLDGARATRPLLNEELDKIKERFYTRLPLYEQCDIEVKVSDEKSPHEFAVEIAESLKKILKEERQ